MVKKGKRAEAVAASFKSSPLYSGLIECKLVQNMRVRDGDKEFCDWLLSIGDGKHPTDGNDCIEIPEKFLVQSKMDLIESTFPNIRQNTNKKDFINSGIICPMNDDVWDINEICLNLMPGEAKQYLSSDRVVDENHLEAPTELLNSRKPSGFPDHNLVLKVGAPVMLLRNLQNGLVNGTRMIVRRMHARTVECEVMVGTMRGDIVFIPRIPMYDRSADFPWTMVRTQLPLRVCFAMTIHKSKL